jgi:hypothetical protein
MDLQSSMPLIPIQEISLFFLLNHVQISVSAPKSFDLWFFIKTPIFNRRLQNKQHSYNCAAPSWSGSLVWLTFRDSFTVHRHSIHSHIARKFPCSSGCQRAASSCSCSITKRGAFPLTISYVTPTSWFHYILFFIQVLNAPKLQSVCKQGKI